MSESLVPLLVPMLGRALLHFVWQGAVIGLVASALLHALRDARSQVRYAVACLALLACALAPLLDIALQFAGAQGSAGTLLVSPLRTPVPELIPALMPALGTATHALAQAWRLDDALPGIVALWASGACALSLRMALGVWWIQRLCRAPQDAAATAWQGRVDALAQRFGLQRQVALRLVGSIASPASVGWWRPVVLLPTALLTRMPVELVEALLAHELAHIRRHDYLVNLLQGAVEALLFYHPVTWWLSRRIRIEREQVADQLAAEVIGAPRRLALALSELSEFSGCTASIQPLPSLALAAHGGQLMSRIEQLVRPALRRSGSGRIAFPLLGVAVACVAFLAHAQVGSDATTTAPARSATPTPAVSAAVTQRTAEVVTGEDTTHRTPYAIVRKGRSGTTMSGSTRDGEAIEALRRNIDTDFLWFRKDNREWVVVDPATVDRAVRTWAPMDPLEKQMQAYDAQMGVHDRNMQGFDTQMAKLSALQTEHPKMDAASRRLQALGRQQEDLALKQETLAQQMTRADDAHRAELSRRMKALSTQQDALSQQMQAQSRIVEAEAVRIQQDAQPMEALGKRMAEAGKPMQALGTQMSALGRQMEQVSKQADRETMQLIDDAMAKGLAKPAPMRR